MRQMEKAWNKTMADEFNPSSINVLDNNMMEWYNKFAPGFMCVGQKPNTFGNGLHTLMAKGVYADAIIKESWYLQKSVP